MKRAQALLFVILVTAGSTAADRPEFLWPIDRPAMITGTFGEYRGAHFHHGIDVSTGGKTGFAVYAADDGYVGTVMYQQWGIGFAVLVRHKNGWRTLYGHMESFSDPVLSNEKVKALAPRIRDRKDFRIDFSGPEIPVRKGTVIGYSGDSGIGLEHFHFEVRKDDNEPVNPLTNGLHVIDRNGTIIHSISLVPLDGSSSVEGSRQEKKYPAVALGRNAGYAIKAAAAPLVSGRIGIKINAGDRIGIRNAVAPYGFDVFADNVPVYRTRFERIEQGLSHRVGLVYDSDSSSLSAYTLYLYDRTNGRGVVRADREGKSIDIRIVCMDAASGVSTLNFTIKTDRPVTGVHEPPPNLSPGRQLDLTSDDRRFSITFPRGSALYEETVTLAGAAVPRIAINGITALSGVYELAPTNLCLDRPAEAVIAYNGNDYRKVGVYRFSRDGRFFSCSGMAYDTVRKCFRIPVTRMGKLFLAKDEVPPRIRFRNGMRLRPEDTLRLWIADIGAGIDLKTPSVLVDGREVAWDYDPDRHCIEILKHNPVWTKGKHYINASVSDYAGNGSGEQKFSYEVR
jgi:hypothetical protein